MRVLQLNVIFIKIINILFKKSDRTSLGLYTSYTHQFAPKFSATLGLRGEAINDFDTDQNVFLPQLQTLYKFNENLTWYTNIGKSFIMPAMNSQFYTTDKDAHNLKKITWVKASRRLDV